jgi:hypothetical protein
MLSDKQVEVLERIGEAGPEGISLGDLAGNPRYSNDTYRTALSLEAMFLVYFEYRVREDAPHDNRAQILHATVKGNIYLENLDSGMSRTTAAQFSTALAEHRPVVTTVESDPTTDAAASPVADISEATVHDGS